MRVRIMLTLAAIENLQTKSIDFVLAYPQADLDVDIYIWSYHKDSTWDLKALDSFSNQL